MIEHYNRIARMLQNKVPVTLEINIDTRTTGDHEHGFNTVAEIPGTDPKLKDEVVMVGGHLDSWISGTGATDNGAGSVVAMEAVRILKALGVKPRRTIRIALWSGEEEGLYARRLHGKGSHLHIEVGPSGVADDGTFDIAQTSAGASVNRLAGRGVVTLGDQTLTLTAAADTFAGSVNGTGGLTLAGGTETFSGVNTYTGATTVASGTTLNLSGSGSIARSSTVTADGLVDISAATAPVSFATLAGAGAVNLGAQALTISGGSTAFAGTIGGTGSFTVAGGTQILSGANAYTGGTAIRRDATLALRGAGSISSSSGLTNDGTFDIAQTTSGTSIATLGGGGAVVLGPNTLTMTAGTAGTSGTDPTGVFSGVISGGRRHRHHGRPPGSDRREHLFGWNHGLERHGRRQQRGVIRGRHGQADFEQRHGGGGRQHRDAAPGDAARHRHGQHQCQHRLPFRQHRRFRQARGQRRRHAQPDRDQHLQRRHDRRPEHQSDHQLDRGARIRSHHAARLERRRDQPLFRLGSRRWPSRRGQQRLAAVDRPARRIVDGRRIRQHPGGDPGGWPQRARRRPRHPRGVGLRDAVGGLDLPGPDRRRPVQRRLHECPGMRGHLRQPHRHRSQEHLYGGRRHLARAPRHRRAGVQRLCPAGDDEFHGRPGRGRRAGQLRVAGSAGRGARALDAARRPLRLERHHLVRHAVELSEPVGLEHDADQEPEPSGRRHQCASRRRRAAQHRGGDARSRPPLRDAAADVADRLRPPVGRGGGRRQARLAEAVERVPATDARPLDQWPQHRGAGRDRQVDELGRGLRGRHRCGRRARGRGRTTCRGTTAAAATGADYRLDVNTAAGFALAGGGGQWNVAKGLGGGHNDTFAAGAYGISYFSALYVAGSASASNAWESTKRSTLGGEALEGRFDAQSFGGRLETGYRFAVAAQTGVTPYVSLELQNFSTPAFAEKDTTGNFALAYRSSSVNDARTQLGARLDTQVGLGTLPVSLNLRAAWLHDAVGKQAMTASFVAAQQAGAMPGAATGFAVNGAPMLRDSVLGVAAAEVHLASNIVFDLRADYAGALQRSSQSYGGAGTLRVTW